MSCPVFRGVGTALITPFTKEGTVDYNKISSLVENQIAAGTNAIIACGTTGEKSTLRHLEHVKVIQTIIETVNGRIPVVAGTVCVSIPMKVNTRTVFSFGTVNEKLPSRSVIAPTFALPWIWTPAPGTGTPLLSTTTPFAVND